MHEATVSQALIYTRSHPDGILFHFTADELAIRIEAS